MKDKRIIIKITTYKPKVKKGIPKNFIRKIYHLSGTTWRMSPSLKTKYYSIKEKRIRKIGKAQCEICGYDKFPEALEGHHIIPLNNWKKNINNLQLLHNEPIHSQPVFCRSPLIAQ